MSSHTITPVKTRYYDATLGYKLIRQPLRAKLKSSNKFVTILPGTNSLISISPEDIGKGTLVMGGMGNEYEVHFESPARAQMAIRP